jgi:hypothetical protein
MHNRTHMVRVGLSLACTHSTAGPALPSIASEHRDPPRLVPLVSVTAPVRIGPERICD